MKRLVCLIFLILLMHFLISCAVSATPMPVNPARTSAPVSTAGPTATQAPAATPTQIEIGSLPGFEDWSVYNERAVDIQAEDGALILALKRRALWYMGERGVLAYKTVEGDFKLTADIYTMKRSDPSQAPGGDGTVQLGGLMARSTIGGQENYVFIVIGDDGNGLSVETKNTTNNISEYNGPSWDSASASLRLCRSGQTFQLYKRHIGSEEPWMPADSFERPDLPASLQVGLNIYTDSTPDLQVRYEDISIEPLGSPEGCEVD